jgi:hypothetical protein
MGRLDKRARLIGRQGPAEGQRYALLPVEVLESAACRTLSGTELKVLVYLAAQFHGSNNGSLTLPLSVARRFGMRSNDTLNRGLKSLVRRGLIELTHQGGLPPYGCSKYALCWWELNNPRGSPVALQPTLKKWVSWEEPPDNPRRKPPVRSASCTKSSPVIGGDSSDDRMEQAGSQSDGRTNGLDMLGRPSDTS